MASTTALFTGLSGLNTHARKLDIIGNNVANVNTTAFKGSRASFETAFMRNFGLGSTPSAALGGVNPFQIGNGVGSSSVQRDFNNGPINATGDFRDLAIDGDGFFMVEGSGSRYYSRAGTFRQDAQDNLVNASGQRLLGYSVDENFNLSTGDLGPINVPIGKVTIAEATTNVSLVGNLDKTGDIPTTGSIIELMGTGTTGPTVVTGGLITAATPLISIADAPMSATPQFSVGQSIRLSGDITKGEGSIAPVDLEITAATTVQDLMDLIAGALGIQDTGGPNPDGSTPGVSVNPATGAITIVGNTGTENNIAMLTGDIEIIDATGASVGSAFEVNQVAEADGESVRTTMSVFDSLGEAVQVDVVMVLEATPNAGPVWRYYVESEDDSDPSISIANGTVQFDTEGQLDPAQVPVQVTIDRQNTGADTPLSFNINFESDSGNTTSLATGSELIGLTTDGLPPGTLTNYGTSSNGLITGLFSNGAQRVLGQVAIAGFSNPAGLVDEGGNLFSTGPNSGPVSITTPGTLGQGLIVSGALEGSNVDLGREFTEMILTSTGYSASSRVIRTTDELLQQLLVLGR